MPRALTAREVERGLRVFHAGVVAIWFITQRGDDLGRFAGDLHSQVHEIGRDIGLGVWHFCYCQKRFIGDAHKPDGGQIFCVVIHFHAITFRLTALRGGIGDVAFAHGIDAEDFVPKRRMG